MGWDIVGKERMTANCRWKYFGLFRVPERKDESLKRNFPNTLPTISTLTLWLYISFTCSIKNHLIKITYFGEEFIGYVKSNFSYIDMVF